MNDYILHHLRLHLLNFRKSNILSQIISSTWESFVRLYTVWGPACSLDQWTKERRFFWCGFYWASEEVQYTLSGFYPIFWIFCCSHIPRECFKPLVLDLTSSGERASRQFQFYPTTHHVSLNADSLCGWLSRFILFIVKVSWPKIHMGL